jgi:hypothetical protein
MSNKLRSEVSFETEDGQSFTLKYDVNALCELEDVLEMGIPEFAAMFSGRDKIRLKHARAAFWAGLRHHKPDISIKQAGELMMEIGGMTRALELVGEALSTAFPEPDEGDVSERPQEGRGSKTRGVRGAQSASSLNNSGGSARERSN